MSWRDTVVMCHDFARIRTYEEMSRLYNGYNWHKPFFDKYGNSVIKVTRYVQSKKRGKYMRIKFISPTVSSDVPAGYTLPVYVQSRILEKKKNLLELPRETFEF